MLRLFSCASIFTFSDILEDNKRDLFAWGKRADLGKNCNLKNVTSMQNPALGKKNNYLPLMLNLQLLGRKRSMRHERRNLRKKESTKEQQRKLKSLHSLRSLMIGKRAFIRCGSLEKTGIYSVDQTGG